MGRSELSEDLWFATHVARGEHEEELDGIIAEWAGRHDSAEIDRTFNGAGVACGPISRIDQVFSDPQIRAREMLVEHHDPEIGPYVGPGIVPKLSETPGSIRWSGPWAPGSHNK